MAGKHRLCLVICLFPASILLFARTYVKNQLWPADNLRLLAEDALQAARGSVLRATDSLFEAQYENELQLTSPGRHAVDRRGAKLERLQTSLDDRHLASTNQIDMCGSLAGKRIVMIGGEHVYRLHVLLLQHRERAERKLFPCPYHEFCTHHHICLPPQHVRNGTPPSRYVKSPTTQALIDTESAVVNYIISDTLFSAYDKSSLEYTSPFVDPMTGVRLRETYWLPAARKADIVILGRGPLSAPGQTYAGNWSFAHHMPDYVDASHLASTTTIIGGYIGYDNVREPEMVPRSLDVLNAAVHLTPSSWYRLPGRGDARTILLRSFVCSEDAVRHLDFQRRRPQSAAENVLILQLTAMLNADVRRAALLEDPWSLLFNAQVYLQNMVLRDILPRSGIVFLPLNVPLVRDGRAGGHAPTRGPTADTDLERMAGIGEAFVTGVDYVLEYLE